MKINVVKREIDHKSLTGDFNLFTAHYFLEKKLNKVKSRFNVFIFHDVGEHSKRYETFIKTFVSHLALKQIEVDCFCMDLPGHGRSEGKRGHIENVKNVSEDMIDLINYCSEENKKTILMGHGLGGLLVCDILHNDHSFLNIDVSGGILLNPAFKFKRRQFHILEKAFLGTVIGDNLKVALRSQASTDEDRKEELNDQDPLYCHKISLSTIWDIQKLGKSLRTSSYYLEYPFFVGVNNDHPIYDEDLTELFCRGFEKSQFQKYFHAPHYVEGEHIGINALKDIIKWFQNEFV